MSARFPRWEKAKDPGDQFWQQIRETKQTWRNTKILTFGPTITSLTLTAVSLQLNGMVMMWRIQQAMQDDATRTARIHPAVHPGNRDEVFIWQNFQPTYRDLGKHRASPPSDMNTSKFYKGFRGKAGNRKPGSYEEALNYITNRPLPSSKNPHFQNESRCTTFLVKISFICMRMKNNFHIKGWVPTLVLKQRPGGTRKRPIINVNNTATKT